MARDITLLTKRNLKVRADYNRLKCQEVIVSNRGEKVAVRLTYGQILSCLRESYDLSIRTLEGILSDTAPKMAVINAATATQPATV